jgi:hypothetical protein
VTFNVRVEIHSADCAIACVGIRRGSITANLG